MAQDQAYMFPTSVKEVEALGWDYIDIILFSGDAFIDHPSFGTAVIARWLQKWGYRVAVVPQPGWRDDLRDFRKLGTPRLYFGLNAGAMDSMVNHYTASKRLRHDDAYTPEGKAGARPDYAVTVYTQILKKLFPDVPVIIGGIEASLRRLTHYDYWKDCLMPSVLVTSGADYLCYGMGERPMLELTKGIEKGWSRHRMQQIPQIAFYVEGKPVWRKPEGDGVSKPVATLGHVRGRGPKEVLEEHDAWEGSRSDGLGRQSLPEPTFRNAVRECRRHRYDGREGKASRDGHIRTVPCQFQPHGHLLPSCRTP